MVDSGKIESFDARHTDQLARFDVKFKSMWELEDAMEEDGGLLKYFKLRERFQYYRNWSLFDQNGVIRQYANAEDLLNSWFPTRLDMYHRRKVYQLDALHSEQKVLADKSRFIAEVCNESIKLTGMNQAQLESELDNREFNRNQSGSYAHLTSMPMISLTQEHRQKIEDQFAKKTADVDELAG